MLKTIALLACVTLVVACKTTPDPTDMNTTADESPAVSSAGFEDRGSVSLDEEAGLLTVYFDYNEATLREDARAALMRNAEFLKQNPDVRVEIQGNCDERGSAEYNLALGMRRAEAAKQYLSDMGVDISRLQAVSYGEENPVVRGSSEVAWSKNRRGDFVSK